MNSRNLLFRGVFLLSLALLIFVVWKQFGSRPPSPALVENETPTDPSPRDPILLPAASSGERVVTARRPTDAALPAEPAPMPTWQDKLDEVLRSGVPEAAKAEEILKLAFAPGLDPDAQAELMQHAVNLLPDERFPALKESIVNPQTPEAVLDVLTTDLLNRPNSIKLPIILEVAKTQGHPKIEEAVSLLQVFLEGDYGEDWPQWELAMQKWLKENPDDPPDPTAVPPPAQ